ncbi:MAG: cyclopropane-fatty-acyl-phospholipid synthase [Fuerstiella sp.]|jgi:cyclopropane-fatty-acyl-phospholipid synthase|nr:cyclopropane-fatty-acyl-phospholipid synthase [Fuerstiella sp.]
MTTIDFTSNVTSSGAGAGASANAASSSNAAYEKIGQPNRSTSSPDALGSQSFAPTSFQRLARRRILQKLDLLKHGTIEYSDPQTQKQLGDPLADGLRAGLSVDDPGLYSQLVTDGGLGFAESYLRGYWRTDDLTGLLRIFCRNLNSIQGPVAALTGQFQRIVRWLQRNTRGGSRRNIAAHYDLSNQFFELFLDPTLMYSSAWFEDEHTSLHAASIAKLDRICRKLELRPSDEVMEIGTGWGGFALHAVTNYGCGLTTATISQAQFARAKQRFADAGITKQVQLLDYDYRDLQGQYDKLVSIEMVEAVGEGFLDNYFRCCGRLLRPGGRFAMQAIVMPETRYEAYRQRTDFIQKYIFPGGFLPSVAALQTAAGRTTNLRLESIEDMSLHYARTLELWRERFFDRLDDVRRLGFDDRFIRMWEYYLCYCEAAFREQAVRVVQIVWDQPAF